MHIDVVGLAAVLMPIPIVVIVLAFVAFRTWINQRGTAQQGALIKRLDELADRVGKIERRMANLETIVLETEKKKEFERL